MPPHHRHISGAQGLTHRQQDRGLQLRGGRNLDVRAERGCGCEVKQVRAVKGHAREQ